MLIGHKQLIEDFKKLAYTKELGHGYLFYGSPRVGKRSFALAFADYLEGGEFDPGEHHPILEDLMLVLPNEEKNIGIDKIREIRNFLFQKPFRSPRRTVIIDEGELLTDEAQNALLKIAEEPPASALVLLVTQDPDRLRPTLRSRFRNVFFSGVPEDEIEKWLVKELHMPASEAASAAKSSMGQPGLVFALLKNEKFAENYKEAKQFLRTSAGERQALIKELVDDETFDLGSFLDILMIAAAPLALRNSRFWHYMLELRREAGNFNLNPRLQLLALAKQLN